MSEAPRPVAGPWRLWTDASFHLCRRRGAAGIVLARPDGATFQYHHPLTRVVSAVEAEHAALLLGMAVALSLGARQLEVYTDATVNLHTYLHSRERELGCVRPRHQAFRQLADQFEALVVIKVPRQQVVQADRIAGGAGDGAVQSLPLAGLVQRLQLDPHTLPLLRLCA